MPEWQALVRQRLGDLGLAVPQEDAVFAELASHLEEVYDEACAQGLCKSEAIERSLAQVTDWHSLSRNIQIAKHREGIMNHRTATLWLPGLTSLTAAMVFLMLFEVISLQPRFLALGYFAAWHIGSISANVLLVMYLPWLALLPFCGAIGALLSRRAGGERPICLAAGMFPWTVLFFLVTFLTVIGQIVPFQHEWTGFVAKLLLVSVPPGIALLLGVIPFLKEAKPAALASTQI